MAKWDAEDYAKNSSQQAKWARELMDRLALRGEEWVLDVGRGMGR
jgi:trans-aconitate methyltransferase